MPVKPGYLAVICVLAIVAVNAFALSADLRAGNFDVNDSVLHYTLAHRRSDGRFEGNLFPRNLQIYVGYLTTFSGGQKKFVDATIKVVLVGPWGAASTRPQRLHFPRAGAGAGTLAGTWFMTGLIVMRYAQIALRSSSVMLLYIS
jgi:hypothetical protein